MSFAYTTLVTAPNVSGDAAQLKNPTLGRLMKDHFAEISFEHKVVKAPFLHRFALGKVASRYFALNDAMPNGVPDHAGVVVQGCVSGRGGQD